MDENKEHIINMHDFLIEREFVIKEYEEEEKDVDEVLAKKLYSGDDSFLDLNENRYFYEKNKNKKMQKPVGMVSNEEYAVLKREHIVKKGETLWDIVTNEYLPQDAWETNEIISEVVLFNKGIIKGGVVNEGDVIKLPTKDSILEPLPQKKPPKEYSHDYHTVKDGESLKSIALNHYGVEGKDLLELIEFIMSYNDGLNDPNTLINGQVIRLPKINKES